MIAVGCISDVKEWTGVHSLLVVPLHNKILNMLGEQITVGQLTNREGITMHIHIMMITMRFTWALRQSTQTAIQHASVPK